MPRSKCSAKKRDDKSFFLSQTLEPGHIPAMRKSIIPYAHNLSSGLWITLWGSGCSTYLWPVTRPCPVLTNSRTLSAALLYCFL